MIGLYYEDGIKWLNYEDGYNYLVTRRGIVYYDGKVPRRVRHDYLTENGVELVRFFMQKIHNGDFYLKAIKKHYWDVCYDCYFGIDKLDKSYHFFTLCNSEELRYPDAYWFKHVIEDAVHYRVGEGEVIAGILLEGGKINLVNHVKNVEVSVDNNDTYLPKAFNVIDHVMGMGRHTYSVTWYNGKVIEIRGQTVRKG